jgi:hypothetical protein
MQEAEAIMQAWSDFTLYDAIVFIADDAQEYSKQVRDELDELLSDEEFSINTVWSIV